MAIWVGGTHELWEKTKVFSPAHPLARILARIGIKTPEQLRARIRDVADTTIYMPVLTHNDKLERLDATRQKKGVRINLSSTAYAIDIEIQEVTDFSPLLRTLGRNTWINNLSFNHDTDTPLTQPTRLENVPEALMQMKKLGHLQLSELGLTNLPATLKGLKDLETLNIDHNQIEKLPDALGELKNLKKLDAAHNKLGYLPTDMKTLVKLESFDIQSNAFEELPSWLSDWKELRSLNASHNKLRHLPKTMQTLTKLHELDIGNNHFEELPEWFGHLQSVHTLKASSNHIKKLPDGIRAMTNLQLFYTNYNALETLPEWLVTDLKKLRQLDVSYNNLKRLPETLKP